MEKKKKNRSSPSADASCMGCLPKSGDNIYLNALQIDLCAV